MYKRRIPIVISLSFLLLLICSKPVTCQSKIPLNHKILEEQINNPSSTDSTRQQALISLVRHYGKRRIDSAIYFSKIYVALSKNLKDEKIMASALTLLGNCYKVKSDYQNALTNYEEALLHMKKTNDSVNMSVLYMNIGNIFSNTGNYDKALANHFMAVDYLTAKSPEYHKTRLMVNKALVYGKIDEHQKCLDLLLHRLHELEGDSTGEVDESLLFNIGWSYSQLEMTEKSILFFERAMSQSIKNDNMRIQPYIHSSKGDIYIGLGKTREAEVELLRSMELLKTQGNNRKLSEVYYQFGKLYQGSQPEKSIEYLEKAIPIARQTKNIDLEKDALKLLSTSLENTGQPNRVNKLLQRIVAIDDSLKILNIEKKAYNEELNHIIRIKEDSLADILIKERSDLASSQSIFPYVYVLGILLLTLISVMIYFMKRNNYHRKLLGNIKEMISPDNIRKKVDIDIKTLAILDKPGHGKVNQTDRSVLQRIYDNPHISNQEIADAVSRSLEGVSSSLRKMYSQYDVEPCHNRKYELVKKIIMLNETK